MLYKYDQLNRIKESKNTDGKYLEKWNYDGNGNILKHRINNQDHTYSYNISQNNQLNNLDNTYYQYDKIGSLVKETKTQGNKLMDWSVYGKLAALSKTGEKYVFSYDATGNKTAKPPTLCVEYRRISAVFYAPFILQIFRFAFSFL